MSSGFYTWSQTAASNATADSSMNWAEGQAPSSVNDSARAMMSVLAKHRDDIGPNIQTAGTSTAYTLTTNQAFDTLAHLANQEIGFFCHAANGASPTLNVDGLGAKAIVTAALGAVVPTGAMAANGVYTVVYSNTASQFILKDFHSNPYDMPIGSGMDYWGATIPNSSWKFADGSAISRTTYATLFGIIGTTYGSGDGSTTFNLPDKTGRVTAGKEASASRLTSSVSGVDGGTLGAFGGLQSHTLTTAQLAVTTPAGTVAATTPAGTISQITPAGSVSVTVTTPNVLSGGTSDNYTSVGGTGTWNTPTRGSLAATGSFTGTPVTPTFTGSASAAPAFTGTPFGSGAAHNNVQPTIICNYIIRVL